MIYLCITPERHFKTSRMMAALKQGFGSVARIVLGKPPSDGHPFVVWGQNWLTLRIVPGAIYDRRPFWIIDNGYWNPARGTPFGYYRLTYCGVSPVLLPDPVSHRADGVKLESWKRGKTGDHVLLAMPGMDFGLACGIKVRLWADTIEREIKQNTDRRVFIRPKGSTSPLETDLRNAWALVTHSSNVAVDAVLAGVPVFVQPTSPAAPVGRTDLDIENPSKPDREQWLHSLACQQFTLDEMRSGVAQYWMQKVKEVYDARSCCHAG